MSVSVHGHVNNSLLCSFSKWPRTITVITLTLYMTPVQNVKSTLVVSGKDVGNTLTKLNMESSPIDMTNIFDRLIDFLWKSIDLEQVCFAFFHICILCRPHHSSNLRFLITVTAQSTK